VPETALAGAAVASIPTAVEIADGVPLISDRAYDSDPLREQLDDAGFELIAPHRCNRTRPATTDGRRLRDLRAAGLWNEHLRGFTVSAG
jgi:hypothetical protein